MKILMIARNTLYSSPGGDTTQIEMTAKYLRILGVNVEVRLSGEKIEYSNFDLVHFFNIIRPDDILPHLTKLQIPFAISTIYVDYSEYEKRNRKGLMRLANILFSSDQVEYLKAIIRLIKNGEKIKSSFYFFKGHSKSIKYIAQKAAILLPNSCNEYNRFILSYNVKQRYKKVVNAIDESLFNNSVKPDNTYKDHVLCVGRIEGRKNQLNLIKALLETGIKLTIVGQPSPNHLQYYQECKNMSEKSTTIKLITHINHEELAVLYKAAKVHVLPSWFETTGLSSLEAGAMNCNIVITRKGDTEEYFKDMAYYCEPDDINSIREAVLSAYHSSINPHLQDYIINNYTWKNTAQQTLEAYKSILV